MEQRISLVTLGVADLQRSMDFYAALGWRGSSPDGDVAFFQAGGMILALWGRDKLAEDSAVERDAGGWGGISLAQNVAGPGEVDAVLAQALEAGGSVPRAGGPTEWGGYNGIFADPDGHRWEIAHNPGWVLHADGTVSLE